MLLSSIKTIICIGSGPSLRQSDCSMVCKSDGIIIAVNNAYKIIPACNFIFSGDYQWWRKNKQLPEQRDGLITTCKYAAKAYGIQLFQQVYSSLYSSSGEKALDFALSFNPKYIILLGYDYSLQYGTHFHGPHIDMPNPSINDIMRFKRSIDTMNLNLTTEIINCSRVSMITRFKRMTLESVLSEIG